MSTLSNASSDPEKWLGLYGDALYRFAMMRVQDTQIAQDIVQETLLAAFKSRHNFSGKSSERTWLTGILKYKILDYFRHKYSHKESMVAAVDTSEADYFDDKGHWNSSETGSNWGDPEKNLDNEQFLNTLEECVNHLPDSMRDLFICSEFEQMDNDELCKVFNISSTNNLYVILSRARLKLRHCLEKNWFSTA